MVDVYRTTGSDGVKEKFVDKTTYYARAVSVDNPEAIGGGTQYTEDAAAAANPVGNALILVRQDTPAIGTVTTDGDNIAARANSLGAQYVAAGGDLAHDAAESGVQYPIKIGGVAKTSEPAAVSNNDRVAAYFDLNGYQMTKVGGVTAALLAKGATTREVVTCTDASTDYAGAGAMPAGTKTLEVYCSAGCIVAMGEATSATKGRYCAPSTPTLFPVTVTGTAADDTVHVQSATAGATVSLTYIPS